MHAEPITGVRTDFLRALGLQGQLTGPAIEQSQRDRRRPAAAKRCLWPVESGRIDARLGESRVRH